jgi:hypothetical protein
MRARNGLVLMEVVVALGILAIAGGALLGVVAEGLGRVERARLRERDMMAGNNLMSAVSLWPRKDLDRRLGERRQGEWLLDIRRESPRLYTAAIRDTATREILLATALYRAP